MSNDLSLYEFGKELVVTKDLDPVYILLHEAQLEDWELERWLLAYWCFYHVGTASWITEGNLGYWDRMEVAARSKDYPRSSERRHFRGKTAITSVAYLRNRGLKSLFVPLLHRWHSLQHLMTVVKEWPGFGPWIGFKVADMLERLGLCQVDFDTASVFLFDSPVEGAKLAWANYGGPGPLPKSVGAWALESLLTHQILSRRNDRPGGGSRPVLAPPRYERPLGVQEAETILCKWKSYKAGHYVLGEDIEASAKALERFPKVRLTRRLHQAGIKGGLWTH